MKTNYTVSDIKVAKAKELPDSWSKQDYLTLLNELDVEDLESLSDSDLHEMLVMALQDKELVSAAEILLEYKLGNVLDDGDRQHIAEEYLHSELWDEHADMSLHKELFNIGILLHDGFSGQMTEPVCGRVTFNLRPYDKDAADDLNKGDLASLLVRVIANGMDENAKLNRVFEDQINEGPFPEAKDILWKFNKKVGTSDESGSDIIELYLSYEWVKDFPIDNNYDSNAFSDK